MLNYKDFLNEQVYRSSTIRKILRDKYVNVINKLNIFETDKHIELNIIILNPENRNEGHGSNIIKDLIKYANDNNKILHLTPTDEFDSNKKKLTDFYKNFGFVYNRGSNKDYSTRDTLIKYPD